MGPNAAQTNAYAPRGQLPLAQVREQARSFAAHAGLCDVLDAVPDLLLILNPQRQVIFANRNTLTFLKVESSDLLQGLRPGEVFNCEHSHESDGGCGMSPACSTCGAAMALFASEQGKASVQECRITQETSGQALDLRVSATPVWFEGQNLTVLAVTDIANQKRRQALERIFFHDVLNTVNAMMACAQVLRGRCSREVEEMGESMMHLARTLADEILAQRQLLAAENNDLVPRQQALDSGELLEEVAAMHRASGASDRCAVVIDPASQNVAFVSDRTLLIRVLANLVKNALEASAPRDRVTLASRRTGGHVEFEIHNRGVIPPGVQLQIFQRSFSTKGEGRGLGTYSVKLFTERYLSGNVSFTTDNENGTVFRVRYPTPTDRPA